MLKGFRQFVFRGNVFDLAIAVVIGTAFTAVVTSIVTSLINPIIAAIGGPGVDGLSVQLISGNAKTIIHFDTIITAVINLLIIALVLYLVFVMPMQKIMEMRKRKGPAAQADPTDIELLTEIRDLLREQRGGVRPEYRR